MFRKTRANIVPLYTGADGSGNTVIDQKDRAVWSANFGETLPQGGTGAEAQTFVAANGGQVAADLDWFFAVDGHSLIAPLTIRSTLPEAKSLSVAVGDEPLLAWLSTSSGDAQSDNSQLATTSRNDASEELPDENWLEAVDEALQLLGSARSLLDECCQGPGRPERMQELAYKRHADCSNAAP